MMSSSVEALHHPSTPSRKEVKTTPGLGGPSSNSFVPSSDRRTRSIHLPSFHQFPTRPKCLLQHCPRVNPPNPVSGGRKLPARRPMLSLHSFLLSFHHINTTLAGWTGSVGVAGLFKKLASEIVDGVSQNHHPRKQKTKPSKFNPKINK